MKNMTMHWQIMAARNWISPFDRGKIRHGEMAKCNSRANGQLGHDPGGSVGKRRESSNSIREWLKRHCRKFRNGLLSASF